MGNKGKKYIIEITGHAYKRFEERVPEFADINIFIQDSIEFGIARGINQKGFVIYEYKGHELRFKKLRKNSRRLKLITIV